MSRLRRGRGDDGTALVEAAFVLPVIIVILFGIIEVGYLYRSASLATGSTRAGARIASAQYGAAYNNAASERTVADSAAGAVAAELLSKGATDTPSTLWIYKTDANGNTCASATAGTPCAPSSGIGSCAIDCFKYTWTAGTKSFTYASGGWLSPDACGNTMDYIGIYVVMNHGPLVAPASLSVRTLTTKSVMRLEGRQGCTTAEGPA
jgi:Flp pilus assembly protein TadG